MAEQGLEPWGAQPAGETHGLGLAASREAGKAAGKFGERHGVLACAEGNGELVLSGGGRGLHAVHLAGGRLFVNHGALVACGTGIAVSYEYAGFLKGAFVAAELSGAGTRGQPDRGYPGADEETMTQG